MPSFLLRTHVPQLLSAMEVGKFLLPGIPATCAPLGPWRSFAFLRGIAEIRAGGKRGNENKLFCQPGTPRYLFTPLIKVMRNKTCCSRGRSWGFASRKPVGCSGVGVVRTLNEVAAGSPVINSKSPGKLGAEEDLNLGPKCPPSIPGSESSPVDQADELAARDPEPSIPHRCRGLHLFPEIRFVKERKRWQGWGGGSMCPRRKEEENSRVLDLQSVTEGSPNLKARRGDLHGPLSELT